MRSSTSSSEPIDTPREARPLLPWGALIALLLLLVVELAVGRAAWMWGYIERSDPGVVDATERIVLDDAAPPKVVVLGSSRTRDGIIPSRLEERLGLERGDVVNLSLTGGTAFDAAVMYERNLDQLRDADVVIFGFEMFGFDGYLTPRERFRRFADLNQRLDLYPDETLRPGLLLGWLWRTFDAKEAIHRWIKAQFVEPPEPLEAAPDGRVVWRKNRWGKSARSDRAEVRRHWRNWQFSPALADAQRRLLERLAGRHKLFVLSVPTRPGYWQNVNRRYPRKLHAFFSAARDTVPHPAVIETFRAEGEHGIPLEDFIDWGHVNPKGSKKVTDLIATRLLAAFPESFSGAEAPARKGDAALPTTRAGERR